MPGGGCFTASLRSLDRKEAPAGRGEPPAAPEGGGDIKVAKLSWISINCSG